MGIGNDRDEKNIIKMYVIFIKQTQPMEYTSHFSELKCNSDKTGKTLKIKWTLISADEQILDVYLLLINSNRPVKHAALILSYVYIFLQIECSSISEYSEKIIKSNHLDNGKSETSCVNDCVLCNVNKVFVEKNYSQIAVFRDSDLRRKLKLKNESGCT